MARLRSSREEPPIGPPQANFFRLDCALRQLRSVLSNPQRPMTLHSIIPLVDPRVNQIQVQPAHEIAGSLIKSI